MEDQAIKLALQVLGTEGVTKLREESAKTRGELQDLAAQYVRGEISAAQLQKGSAAVGRVLAQQTELISKLDSAIAASANATTAKAAADAKAVASANDLLGRLTLTAEAVQQDTAATVANTTARRQAANAADGAAREEQHLSTVLHAAAAAEREATTTASQLAAAQARTGTAVGGATNKMAGLGQAGLQTGRILQDFSQGGIGGIINNIEGLSMALGLGAGAAGALTLVGVAALTATPYVKAWYAEMTGGANEIPKAADALKRVEDELSGVTKKLDEYREKQKLTNVELVDYNRLSREQVALEKQKNEEAKERRDLEAVTGIVGKERQERAAGFKEAVAEAGGGETATSSLRAALERLNPDKSMAEIAAKADDLMREAGQGWKDAIEEVRKTVRAGEPDEKRQKLADEIQGRTPEAKKGREIGEARQKAEEDQAKEAMKADAEFWRGVAEQEKEAAQELAGNVKELLDDVGVELKAAAETAARSGLGKAGVAAKVTPEAVRAAENLPPGVFTTPAEVAAAAAEKVADDATDSRARARRARLEPAAEKKAQTAEQKEGAAAAKHISDVSDVDEQAAALAAQIRAQGGVNGRRMNVEQQQRYVQSRIFNDLRKRVGGQQAQIASGPLAEKAFQTADDAAGVLGRGVNQQGRAGAMGLNNQGKLIAVAQMLAVQAQRAAMAQAQQGQAIEKLMRDTAVGSRSNQRHGR